MAITENLPALISNPMFIGIAVVVVAAIVAGVVWWLFKSGKLPF